MEWQYQPREKTSCGRPLHIRAHIKLMKPDRTNRAQLQSILSLLMSQNSRLLKLSLLSGHASQGEKTVKAIGKCLDLSIFCWVGSRFSLFLLLSQLSGSFSSFVAFWMHFRKRFNFVRLPPFFDASCWGDTWVLSRDSLSQRATGSAALLSNS